MSFHVYILYSLSLDSYYIGQTADLETRTDLHLKKAFVGNFTKRASDWVLFYCLECPDRRQALNVEHHIKRMKSKKYIQDLKLYPEIGHKLKERYP